ncbi:MBL fold metallo-hydrolase [Suttonella ornithocola]|uniref:Metal-dependent hydrolase n=1 Tax=Suttonella ornithocola TaxID=279832 RepID=A0A380MYS2_9GAMM|nr:MBL fold metallo-hydrolase [Suttonella ornithocola]SUO97438.1 metal-dependent hydrolase [Suttonella ornithocola]
MSENLSEETVVMKTSEHSSVDLKRDHYHSGSGRFFNPEPQRGVQNVLSALWQMLVAPKKMRPPCLLPALAPDWQAFYQADEDGLVRVIWLGHSSLLLRVGAQTLLIDPVFAKSVCPLPIMMFRFQSPPLVRENLPKIDTVIISHNHYDHLEQATITFFRQTETRFIVPLGLERTLIRWGIAKSRISALDWWECLEEKSIRYTALPARHDSGRGLFSHARSLWMGMMIEDKQNTCYYSGDSAFGKHFAEIAQRFPNIDLAFIENGQYNERWPDNHLFPEQTAEVAKILRPKRFMPIHWGAYALSTHTWNEPICRSYPLVVEAGIMPLTQN